MKFKLKKKARNLTRYERHNKMVQEIFDHKNQLDNAMAEFLKSKGLSDEEVENLKRHTGLGKNALDDYTKDYVAWRANEIQNKYKGTSAKEAKQIAESEAVQAFAKNNYAYFFPKLLGLRADEIIGKSYNDQTYDIDRLREKYGANLEGLASILPKEALGTHKLYSVDVNENGVVTHKIVLDVNDSDKVDKGDITLESWTGNERGGATGTQSKLTWDKNNGVTVQAYANGASSY